MDVKAIGTMIRDFQKETMKTEMNNEMMGDAMDMGDAVGEEADDVYDSILAEIGMDVENGAQIGVGGIASNKVAAKAQAEEVKDGEVDDLEARMAALGGM